MDHHSVYDNDSNYGDDEDEQGARSSWPLSSSAMGKEEEKPPIPVRKRPSQCSFRPGNGNYEVDAFLRS